MKVAYAVGVPDPDAALLTDARKEAKEETDAAPDEAALTLGVKFTPPATVEEPEDAPAIEEAKFCAAEITADAEEAALTLQV
jgi:hypothetical protein